MRAVMKGDPLSVFVFFAVAICIPMISGNPVIALISLMGAVACNRKHNTVRKLLFTVAAFLAMALINPLFNRSGASALFYINDLPVTLEALLYGASSAISIIAVIYWFFSFSRIMSSDKIIYLFGKLSPHIALLFSSVLRFVPTFLLQYRQTRNTQKCIGAVCEDSIISKLKCEIRVFSVMVTRCTENGIITADSMEARGYGSIRRTSFSFYKTTLYDVLYIILFLLLNSVVIYASLSGDISFVFYPTITIPHANALSYAAYICYALFVFLPVITQLLEEIRWKYLQSRI